MSKFAQSIANYSGVLQSRFDSVRKSVSDSDVKGHLNEKIVATFLRDTIPNWFVATNSQLLDSQDRTSDEVDVAVCNQYQAICQPEGGILIVDGVDFVVQVKALLDDTELDRAFSNYMSVKRLKRAFRVGETVYAPQTMPTDWYVFTPYIVLAFASKLKGETLHHRLHEKSSEVELPNQPDAVFVLDRGLSYINCRDRRGTEWTQKGQPCEGWIKMQSDDLTLFEFIRFTTQNISYVTRVRPPLSLYFPGAVGYLITQLEETDEAP